jgi:hypothetical protein
VAGPFAFRSPAKVDREVVVRVLFEPKMSAVQAIFVDCVGAETLSAAGRTVI